MAKARARSRTKELTPRNGTGLLVLCPAARWWNGDHLAFVEVRTCRNGSCHLHCPGCRATMFMRDDRWKSEAKTIEQIQRTMVWHVIYPAHGSALVAPRVS